MQHEKLKRVPVFFFMLKQPFFFYFVLAHIIIALVRKPECERQVVYITEAQSSDATSWVKRFAASVVESVLLSCE